MRIVTEKFQDGLLIERITADFTPTDPPSMPTADALVAEPNVIRGPWGDLDTLKDRLP